MTEEKKELTPKEKLVLVIKKYGFSKAQLSGIVGININTLKSVLSDSRVHKNTLQRIDTSLNSIFNIFNS